MITDCPNCSTALQGDIAPGDYVGCPFCGENFEVCSSPFDQLRKFMETHWSDAGYGSFRNYGYPYKNYTGWILHRIDENDRNAVIDLMTEFSHDRSSAAKKVNTLWNFDFSSYLTTDTETEKEIRALWLRVRFTSHARPESQNIAVLLSQALWPRKIELTPEWTVKALALFEKERQELDPDGTLEIEPVTEDNLSMSLPQNNPLCVWATQAPVAIRERLWAALKMCGYGYLDDDRPPNNYQFKLDRAQEDRWGADCGYASKYLIDSNIFVGPLPETYEKLFSKNEFFAFLSECGLTAKASSSRRQMLEMLRAQPGGDAWFERKVEEQKYVRLQPTLSKYLDEIKEGFRRGYRLYEAIAMIPVPGKLD